MTMMNIWLRMIDDLSMDAKFYDFAERDRQTEQWTDGATDGQRHRLIGMRWTHPKMQAKSAVLKPFYCRGTLCYGKIFMLSTQVRGAVKDKGVVIRKWNPPAI